MTPKKNTLFYAILWTLAYIVILFVFEDSKPIDILYILPLIIMYLIMYKISDKIDIRYANFIFKMIPLLFLIIMKLLLG